MAKLLRIAGPLLAALCIAASATCTLAQSPDAVFLTGLRERRLFGLAEQHCRQRLANPAVVDPLRTELIVEQIRTLATHALNATAGERDALWKQARQVASEAARTSPLLPRALLVRLQDALTPLAAGELGRQEHETGALTAEQMEPTRQALREAEGLLATLDKELTAEIPLRRRTPPRPGGFTAGELASLQQQTRRELARAYRNRALLYEPGSDNRLALLLRATETLQTSISQLAADDPLLSALRLDLALGQRLLARYDEAGQLLTGLDADGIEPAVRLAARSELIRLAIDQGDQAAAERLMEQGRSIEGRSSAELDLAWFEAYLELARKAKEPAAAKGYQDQAAETARALEATHGPYWGRRADQLLAAKLPQTPGTVNVELLARAANRLFVQREFERAIAAYDDAAHQARAAGDLQASFTLAYKGALIQQQRQSHAEASRRFRSLAKSLPTHPQAPAAHLSAAWHAAQLVKANAAASDAYGQILREHLTAWPGHESAAQARLWLGRWHESRREWTDAAAAYSHVPRASEHFAAAVAGLAAASRSQLADLSAAGESTQEPAAAAVARLKQILAAKDDMLPTKWTVLDRIAALAAAELMLAYQPGFAADAEKLIGAALRDSEDAPAEWKTAAQAQLVVAQASQPDRHEEALATLRKLGGNSAEQLLPVLHGLDAARKQSRPELREPIAKLQLAAIEAIALQRESLTAEVRQSLDRAQVEALAAAGRRDEALAAYRKLAAADPDNGEIQQGHAELLLAGDDRPSLAAALAQWRTIASRSRPQSERWMLAKYSIAFAQFKLGDKAEAAKLLRYVLELPPGLAGSEWEAMFRELLKRCNS